MSKLINGKKLAQERLNELSQRISVLNSNGVEPLLHIVLVGSDPASKIYVKNKQKAVHKIGAASKLHELPESASQHDVIELITKLDKNSKTSGIILQLPLPHHLDANVIIEHISPNHDVDCLTQKNLGKLVQGSYSFAPPTPSAILQILKHVEVELRGKNVTLVGAGRLVGKPLSLLLLHEGATLTICNSDTKDLKSKTSSADILISAVGKANLIIKDMVKEGAVVIDVGIDFDTNEKMTGDVDTNEVLQKVSFITPTPGGVGPNTVAELLANLVTAAEISNQN